LRTSRFTDRQAWVKGLVLGGVICVVIGLFYFLDLRPTFRHIEQYKREIMSLTAENDTYHKEILGFKKPTLKETRTWQVLSTHLRMLIPEKGDILQAARLLAEMAARNHLMDVSIKMPTHSASSPSIKQIAGNETSPTKKEAFQNLQIHSFSMEMSFISSLQDGVAFLDEIATNQKRLLQFEMVDIVKDFPFIRTKVVLRFYYGGKLNVKE